MLVFLVEKYVLNKLILFQEPVDDDIAITEKVFEPGTDVKHEITDEVRNLAEKMLSSISSKLQLVNVTDAVSTVSELASVVE